MERTCNIAPISRTHATAIWNTTSAREMRLVRRLVLRPPSRRTAFVSAREDIQAGRSPDSTAAASIATTLIASADASTSNVIQDGGGLSRLWIALESQLVAP